MNLIKHIKIGFFAGVTLLFISCNTKEISNIYCPNPELGIDALVSQGYPDKNYSKLESLNLLALTRNDTIENDSRFLLKFNFNSIPLKTKIDSAFIYLIAKPPGHFGTNNSFRAERIIENWDDKIVNWQNQPRSDSLNYIKIQAPDNKLQDYKINVTTYVNNVAKLKYKNYGLLFKLDNEKAPFKGLRFFSSNTKEEINRPKLVVYFR
ncbi:hypothetical protein BFP78_03245 [Gaetbulibacter sp. 5U11]|nr:hypothetical protein BFP78_03245 [Gaetbulibacter sp. 5U11]